MKATAQILALTFTCFCLTVAPLLAADDMKMGKSDPMTESLRLLKGKEFEMAFLQDMIQHHGSAIDMASLAETNAESAEVKKMALGIITKQKEEIGQMTGWLKAWHGQEPMRSTSTGDMDMKGAGDMKGHEAMMKMDAMMEEMLAKLKTAKGAEFDQMFLKMMSMHHQDAVDMARLVEGRTERDDLEKLAKGIVKDQEKEIAEMKSMLKS